MAKKLKSKRHNTLQPSAKQRLLLRGMARGMNVSEAGRYAGYGTRQGAHDALKRIKQRAPDILERLGYGLDKSLTEMIEMAYATKTLFLQHEGHFTNEREVPDNETRFRARDRLLYLHNAYPERSVNQRHAGVEASKGITIDLRAPDSAPSPESIATLSAGAIGPKGLGVKEKLDGDSC